MRIVRSALLPGTFLAVMVLLLPNANAQQTLGGITGTVSDTSGAVISGATVSLLGDETKLSRTQTTNANGTYLFVNLPIGNYTLSFTQQGFQSQTIPAILVQANRTATVNAELKVGNVNESITVEETPLINMVDTTNGYVMDKLEIDSVPLPTSSFTQLTLLSPGVNTELQSGAGANEGLGNAPIWANGQRDTSNSFQLNGVDAKNLFNGKTTSNVSSSRVVNATGVSTASALFALPIQSSASVYLAIGEAIPSPPQETIQEVRVNTSMYDAQQGSTSGAHIDMSTASGTNNIHGSAYVHRGTNWLNADPYFYNADPNIPASEKNPSLHRYTAGGTIGLPIKKDKLFFFGSYQHTHASDEAIGIYRPTVPPGMFLNSDPNYASNPCLAGNSGALAGFRSVNCLAYVANANNLATALGLFDTQAHSTAQGGDATPASIGIGSGFINPIAYALFNYGCPKNCIVPWANPNALALTSPFAGSFGNPYVQAFPEDAEEPGTAYFIADQAVANMDWNPNSAHSFFAKYYYQHDPTTAPYAFSSIQGFKQHLDAGSQVISLSHTQIAKSNLSFTETFGFIREKAYSIVDQPFTPQGLAAFAQTLPEIQTALTNKTIQPSDLLINTFGSPVFPGMSITWPGTVFPSVNPLFNIGAGGQSMGAFVGVFQNRFNPSANAIWTHGRHTVTFGGSFAYTQLNARDRRSQLGMIAAQSTNQFLQGELINDFTYNGTLFMNGNPNRYFRAKETGDYIQDKFQFRSNLTITAGLRFDWMGGFTEKNGNLLNFDPSQYHYDETKEPTLANPTSTPFSGTGLIVAGNSPHATSGVSNSTLTGRQWGFAPRMGLAWTPKMFNNKIVVRAGWGLYYDRGELYTYLSPGVAQSITPGGPFGINQQQPFVTTQFCTPLGTSTFTPCPTTLSNPWGTSLKNPPTGDPTTIANTPPGASCAPLPSASQIQNFGCIPFYLGVYARNNKLPYTMNSTLDIQWQPRNDLAVDIGYVNALGRHEVIPIPFNQARIASPSNPLCGPATVCPNMGANAPYAQIYTYGYTPSTTPGCNFFSGCGATLPDGTPYQFNSEGGNLDERVPYIGYAGESLSYKAEGVSAYNALQVHIEKRISHGLAGGVSYTFSRSFDEQSALGLFYNGSNPLQLRGGYAPSDFDRTHVVNIDYHYEFPKLASPNSFAGKVGNGWAVQGLIILQSGQPFSIVDYSGAVGSIFYSINDGITNPIVPLTSNCTPESASTGAIGNNFNSPAIKASCVTLPLLQPGDLNGAIPQCTSSSPNQSTCVSDSWETNFIPNGGQRNIFRQSWQKRGDISLLKVTQLTERFSLKYTFDVFNLTNHPSFDIPIDNVNQNPAFSPFPVKGTCPAPSSPCGATASSTFYSPPAGLGQTVHTIGGSREIQMSLNLSF
ncbi:MAG TPA: carboxypeptidase-like regulatory domain-containing protein [Candidatus Acidoferrales bacterium]|nr:carboxypeptidase-like regulatory domain-containing protein [Candidatus Acidoferrales bacterium]